MRSPLPVGPRPSDFAQGAVADAVDRATSSLGVSGELSTSEEWGTLLAEWATKNNLTAVATAYAPVGPVAELLSTAGRELDRHGIKLLQLRRPYDSMTWPHAQRGYFKLKEQIPAFLKRLEIAGGDDEIGSAAI